MNNTTYARLTELREAYIKADQKAKDAAKTEYEFWKNHRDDPQWESDGRSTWHGLVNEANDLREAARIARGAYDSYFDTIRCDNVDVDEPDHTDTTGNETDGQGVDVEMACGMALNAMQMARKEERRDTLREVKTRLGYWIDALETNRDRAEKDERFKQVEALDATIDHYKAVIRRIIDPMLTSDSGEEEA